MDGFLQDFKEDIKMKSHDIVNASIEFYEQIMKQKLPTPTQFHYTFNLRDLSKVFMGMSKVNSKNTKDTIELISLWTHEMQRVFKDRLNSSADLEWFDTTLDGIMDNYLNVSSR